ncbi:hypothetical protein niasHS_016413 [Heterodera schachtii]|uniref:Ubiquitin-like domain-containing protein n=1 Tax=Heterodera schachtii TaxID=97005 RepID=A0ABD2HN04_HETSC
MNHFGFGISAGLTVFMLLMIRSSIADYEIKIMMFAYRKYNDQTIFTVMVKGKDTVADLKKKISEELKVELEPEILMLRSDKRPYDSPFEDTKTMNNIGIVKDSLLYLTFDEFEMFVHYNEQNYPIWVSEKDTVKILKNKVIQELNLDSKIAWYDLKLSNQQSIQDYDMLWQDNVKIGGGYGIRKGSIVYVDRDIVYDTLDAFKIRVQYEGQKHAVLVKGVDTVRNLKVKIQNIREIGILRDQQSLAAADGVVLEEDEETMNYYKIKEHSTVLLTRAAEMEQQHDEKPSSSRKKEKKLGTGTKIMGFLRRHRG